MPRKKSLTLAETLEAFLGDLSLGAGEEVRASLARELVAAFTEAPAYARGKLAAELRAVLGELEAVAAQVARESEWEERRNKRVRERAWASDG